MRNAAIALFILLVPLHVFGQTNTRPPKVKVLTLGVFHFAYPNLDAVTTAKKDQISVLDEPCRTQIVKISEALNAFRPTIIAVEVPPEKQFATDSMYALYRASQFELGRIDVTR